MATLTVMPGDKTAEVGEGTTLLAALQGLGIKLATNDCGGNAQCGTCHIFIQEGRKGLAPSEIGEVVFKALTLRRPKIRYAVVPGAFRNWILPRLLPKRMVDRVIARATGLLPD